MATLRGPRGQLIELRAQHLIGRSRSGATTLPAPELSAQHAAVRWSGAAWLLRDLGSRNGTFLDGERLAPGESRALTVGAAFTLGSPAHRFVVEDLSPPEPLAIGGGSILRGEGGLLALPDGDDPQVVVFFDDADGWLVGEGGDGRPVESGAAVTVAGIAYTLELPEPVDRTVEARAPAGGAPSLALAFRVSADEEYVEVEADVDGILHPLKPRAHQYVLLVMAQARLADREAGDVPEGEQGWLYTSDLMRMTGAAGNQLYVSLHRARKELEALLPPGSPAVVERRSTTRQVRLGVAELTVGPA